MGSHANKILNQGLRKGRVRSKISGTATRPRLSVSISNKHVSAQLIDDNGQRTVAASTSEGQKMTGTMTEQAALIGTDIAKKAKKSKIETIVFDRNGHKYAKRLCALAEAARKEGLRF